MSEEFNEENVTMADLEDHFDDANPWNVVQSYLEKGTVLPVKIEGIVNGGAIAMVEGIRGFIPASRLSLSYIEDLESYLLKDIEVQVKMCIRDRPCTTLISTAVWLSAAVEKIWLFFVGIVVFLSISLVATPPIVSIDSDNGVTSRRRISPAPVSPASLPP